MSIKSKKYKKNEFLVYSFYRFVDVNNKEVLKNKIDDYCKNKTIRGTVLISDEGINATISGIKKDLSQVAKIVRKNLSIRKLDIKVNLCSFLPFNRMKVRLKKEIVTMGVKNLNLNKNKAKYLNPAEWNQYLNDDNVKIIDTRNDYEIAIGKFKNSINIHTNSFRDFPNKFKNIEVNKKNKILMYCTGGIRCEKASAFLSSKGYKNVFQLKGGILNYLNFVKETGLNTMWSGECFVFDNRITINKELKKGKFTQCYGCRHPLTKRDLKLRSYRKGVCCKFCIDSKSETKINALITRQNQIERNQRKQIKDSFQKIFKV